MHSSTFQTGGGFMSIRQGKQSERAGTWRRSSTKPGNRIEDRWVAGVIENSDVPHEAASGVACVIVCARTVNETGDSGRHRDSPRHHVLRSVTPLSLDRRDAYHAELGR